MPDIYTYFGFIFSFYSNEHEPIHVHVEHQDKMTIFDMIIVDGELVELKKRDKGKPLAGNGFIAEADGADGPCGIGVLAGFAAGCICA